MFQPTLLLKNTLILFLTFIISSVYSQENNSIKKIGLKTQNVFIGEGSAELKNTTSAYYDLNVKSYFCIEELDLKKNYKQLINQRFNIIEDKVVGLEISMLLDFDSYKKANVNYPDTFFWMEFLKKKTIEIDSENKEIRITYLW